MPEAVLLGGEQTTTAVEWVVFIIAATTTLLGSFGVIMARNPVHAALSLVGSLFSVAVLFLNQGAEFLAAVQVIVYTGAIVILILFVLMLLGIDTEEDLEDEPLRGQMPVAVGIGVLLTASVFALTQLVGFDVVTGTPEVTAAIRDDMPNINQIGRLLFTDFVVATQLAGVMLTVAVVGAVVMARRPREYQPIPEPESMDAPLSLDPTDQGADNGAEVAD
ncbi:MAG: NADH-quinone oxidoreductase subunit J [Acidimicrobiia bacterium]|nr:NADH-quinone oxidoreductase subunit J [Acidimicrobiia bacterium]